MKRPRPSKERISQIRRIVYMATGEYGQRLDLLIEIDALEKENKKLKKELVDQKEIQLDLIREAW